MLTTQIIYGEYLSLICLCRLLLCCLPCHWLQGFFGGGIAWSTFAVWSRCWTGSDSYGSWRNCTCGLVSEQSSGVICKLWDESLVIDFSMKDKIDNGSFCSWQELMQSVSQLMSKMQKNLDSSSISAVSFLVTFLKEVFSGVTSTKVKCEKWLNTAW